MVRLADRVAIVTGGAGGIGRETALAMAREGADVLVADLDLEMGMKVAEEIRSVGRRGVALRVNVSRAEDVQAMVRGCLEGLGGLDILVNAAAILTPTKGLSVSESEWDRVLSVNLKGTFLCCQAAIPAMTERGRGWIVNFTSSSGLAGSAFGDIPYSASKAGMVGLTKTLARLLAPRGINVNAIAPQLVDTEMLRRGGERSSEQVAALGRALPIGRVARPREIAEVVVFLASEAASYVVGETVCVTGGGLMH